jgi:hypothetical protein
MNDLFVSGFLKTLWILKDYLPVIVIGGGWAPFIYHQYLLENKAKDLYYIFDIITGCSQIMPAIMVDFTKLSKCANQLYAALDEHVIENHLRGSIS